MIDPQPGGITVIDIVQTLFEEHDLTPPCFDCFFKEVLLRRDDVFSGSSFQGLLHARTQAELQRNIDEHREELDAEIHRIAKDVAFRHWEKMNRRSQSSRKSTSRRRDDTPLGPRDDATALQRG